MSIQVSPSKIIDSRHPSVLSDMAKWELWRMTYEGGEEFRDKYLERFTNREDPADFAIRKKTTPIPTFAKSALNDIRNSIFQRMRDITRRGGSTAYQNAVAGLDLGVDRRGATMNAFLGMKVLTDLLVMGRVGVFCDAPVVDSKATLAETGSVRPYLYHYPVEDIFSWTCAKPDEPSEFQAVLLRDTVLDFDQRTYLPMLTVQRYRMLWIDRNSGRVNLQFYDLEGNEIDRNGQPSGPVELELTRIPFVMLDIRDSLLKDVCHHQIALLNLGSSDVNYALKANFPFYVEQRDLRAVGAHLKQTATAEGTASSGGQPAADADVRVGVTQGRSYDKGMNAPQFINPSSEPLKASLDLQEKLENDIRKLVNLAVVSLSSRSTSAEAKSMDNQGLEAGLSFIGLVLESAERQIAEHWAAYEHRSASKREIATVKYPDRYSLKTDTDRIDEADKLSSLMFKVPGRSIKREIAKCIVTTLLGGKVAVGTIQEIEDEIDAAKYTTSDPDTIIKAQEAGLVGEQVASEALGFDKDEYKQAREDHAARAVRILQAQMSVKGTDPAARGVADLSGDPAAAGKAEKQAAQDNTLRDNTAPRVRGEGQNKE